MFSWELTSSSCFIRKQTEPMILKPAPLRDEFSNLYKKKLPAWYGDLDYTGAYCQDVMWHRLLSSTKATNIMGRDQLRKDRGVESLCNGLQLAMANVTYEPGVSALARLVLTKDLK